MGWYLETTRIYVTGLAGSGKQIIARLQPLAGGTINQIFGVETETKKVKGYIIGEDNLSAIKYMATSGDHYNLIGNGTDYGEYYVASFSWDRLNILSQTVTDDCTDPMFEFNMELYAY